MHLIDGWTLKQYGLGMPGKQPGWTITSEKPADSSQSAYLKIPTSLFHHWVEQSVLIGVRRFFR